MQMKFHYHVHRTSSSVYILSYYITQSVMSDPISLRSRLRLSSHLRLDLSSCLFLSCFPTNTLCATVLARICATCPAHLILLYLISEMMFGNEYIMMLHTMHFSPVSCYPLPHRPKYLPQHLFWIVLSINSSINMRDQVPRP